VGHPIKPHRGRDVEPVVEHAVERLSGYIDRLFSSAERVTERVKDRLAERVADRLADAVTRRSSAVVLTEQEYREYIETMEVLEDEEAMLALREADKQPDDEARPYDEIRRELGLA
jgi:hypothetical protein